MKVSRNLETCLFVSPDVVLTEAAPRVIVTTLLRNKHHLSTKFDELLPVWPGAPVQRSWLPRHVGHANEINFLFPVSTPFNIIEAKWGGYRKSSFGIGLPSVLASVPDAWPTEKWAGYRKWSF